MKIKKIDNLLSKIIILLIFMLVISFIESELSKNSYANINNSIKDGNIEIYFFDVGEADSILIREKDNSMLIDAGNNEDGANLVEYIQNDIGLDRINIVVGTHPHEDHIGGLDDIINSFKIDKVYLPNATTTSKTFTDLLDAIENNDLKISIPKINENIELGNMMFKVLYIGNDESDLNNTSIILRLDYGNTSYLFTGDATSKAEEKILNKDIKCDVLKIGHHGSSYSTSVNFLDRVNPKYAIISVDKDNIYNHPSKSVLKKLEKRNISIYRTDRDGTIKITSDGNIINFEKISTNING